MTNPHTLSKILMQLDMLMTTYDLSLYDISEIRELSYREGFVELYNIVSESPTKYFYEILNRYE